MQTPKQLQVITIKRTNCCWLRPHFGALQIAIELASSRVCIRLPQGDVGKLVLHLLRVQHIQLKSIFISGAMRCTN